MKIETRDFDLGTSYEALHLSEEQIDDELIGDLGVEASAHLAGCAHCAQRVAQASEPMESFRDVTMAWSERRSATMPMVATPAQGLGWQRRMGWAMATFGLAVGIVMTGSGDRFAALTRPGQTQQVESVSSAPTQMAVVVEPVVGPGNVAQEDPYSADNHVLTAIDSAVTPPAESAAALGLETVSDTTARDAGQILLEN